MRVRRLLSTTSLHMCAPGPAKCTNRTARVHLASAQTTLVFGAADGRAYEIPAKHLSPHTFTPRVHVGRSRQSARRASSVHACSPDAHARRATRSRRARACVPHAHATRSHVHPTRSHVHPTRSRHTFTPTRSRHTLTPHAHATRSRPALTPLPDAFTRGCRRFPKHAGECHRNVTAI